MANKGKAVAIATNPSGKVTVIRDEKPKAKAPKMTIPVAVVAGIIPHAAEFVSVIQRGYGINRASQILLLRFTGYDMADGSWSFGTLLRGYAPLVGGYVAHKVANRIGINRMLARAGVPYIRI